ncbi:MAG: DUF3267 domain-containing protein [Clostridiales bacterium]|nr:DUF3267 domain-containing protein [Candidatus Crickella merdequi]
MKLHYMGRFDLDEKSLPHRDDIPDAIMFREASNTKELAIIANGIAIVLTIACLIIAFVAARQEIANKPIQLFIGSVAMLLAMFPHELIHGICFREDVYLYTNLKQGMLFVIGTETMSKGRFIFMSMLPNIIFGFIPFIIGLINPGLVALLFMGALAIGAGAGDYYNVFNALTQVPHGAKVFLSGFHSYWFLPKE